MMWIFSDYIDIAYSTRLTPEYPLHVCATTDTYKKPELIVSVFVCRIYWTIFLYNIFMLIIVYEIWLLSSLCL